VTRLFDVQYGLLVPYFLAACVITTELFYFSQMWSELSAVFLLLLADVHNSYAHSWQQLNP